MAASYVDAQGRTVSASVTDGLATYEVEGAGSFSFPAEWPFAENLSELKAAAVGEVNARLAHEIVGGVMHPGSGLHVLIDDASRANLSGLAATALAAASGAVAWPASYQQGWIAIENQRIPLPTPADALALAALAGDRYAQLRQYARDLKDAVADAPDAAALAAINLTEGWPQ